jgi:adenine-specific DNA-methyltransferase
MAYVFKPQTGEVISDGTNDPYSALKTTLKAEIDAEAWASLNSDTSRPFRKPKCGRIAVKVINQLRDEVMKVFRV